jgi:protein SCO1/2
MLALRPGVGTPPAPPSQGGETEGGTPVSFPPLAKGGKGGVEARARGRARTMSSTLSFAALALVPITVVLLLTAAPGPARAQDQDTPGATVNRIGFDQKLGVRLPLDRRFRDESGRELALGELFGRRPVILAPVYYRCPLLCSQTLNALTRSLKPLSLDAGKGFDVIAVSIDPEETPGLASKKKASYLERYDRPGTESGWHFLTGDPASIAALTGAIGFRYTYNSQSRLYAHAAGIVVVTPDGRVSRYYYGIDYSARDLQAEIQRARGGRIGSPVSGLLLLCYDYDAATGKYTLSILRLTRALGMATVLALGSFLFVMFRRDRVRRRGLASGEFDTPERRDPGDGDDRIGARWAK